MPIGSAKIGVLGAGLVPGGTQTFNASGTFSVPPGVKKVNITGKGATGAAGNPGNAGNAGGTGNPGQGGGGGNAPSPNGILIPGGFGGVNANSTAAGSSGNSGSAGTAGNPGNTGATGQASTGLTKTFCGGAGGQGGTGGNAGNAGTGGSGGNKGCDSAALNNLCPGAGGNPGGGAGAPGSGAPPSYGGGGGGGAGETNAGSAGSGYPNPNTPGIGGAGGNPGGGIGGYGSCAQIKPSNSPWPCHFEFNTAFLRSICGVKGSAACSSRPACASTAQQRTPQATPNPYAFNSRNYPWQGSCNPNISQGSTGVFNPFNYGFPGPVCCLNVYVGRHTSAIRNSVKRGRNANNCRAGGGGSGGNQFPGAVAFSGAGGGGRGGAGNAGAAGNPGNAGNPGSAANPTTFNCVPVTPGSPYPIVVGSPGGQIVISWNPQ